MSKTQEKRARRLAEQQAFLAEKWAKQTAVLEQNYADGLELFEKHKDKLSEDDRLVIEKEMATQREFIDKFKTERGIDVTPRS